VGLRGQNRELRSSEWPESVAFLPFASPGRTSIAGPKRTFDEERHGLCLNQRRAAEKAAAADGSWVDASQRGVLAKRMNGVFNGCRTAALGDVSLAYREQGSGEPVVLVHGTVSDLRVWDLQLAALGANFRAIAYSRRYARPNPDIESGADDQMSTHVEDLLAFLQVTGADPAHLVGHSWGGFIALLAAIRAPHAVRGLVLMEPPAVSLFVSTPPEPLELLWLLVRRPRTAAAVISFGANVIEPARKAFARGDDAEGIRAFGEGVLGKRYFADMPEDRKQVVWENRSSARAQLLGAGFPPLRDRDVRCMRTRTLLVTGEKSPAIMQRTSERLAHLIPNSQSIQIAGASHQMQVDNPAMFNDVVGRFLSLQE
jgi:pimeloyl-ACP methyl ester carboxylesterase